MMNFHKLIESIKPQLIKFCGALIVFLFASLLLNYMGVIKTNMNWYLIGGLIIGYILAEIIKYYYKKSRN